MSHIDREIERGRRGMGFALLGLLLCLLVFIAAGIAVDAMTCTTLEILP